MPGAWVGVDLCAAGGWPVVAGDGVAGVRPTGPNDAAAGPDAPGGPTSRLRSLGGLRRSGGVLWHVWLKTADSIRRQLLPQMPIVTALKMSFCCCMESPSALTRTTAWLLPSVVVNGLLK